MLIIINTSNGSSTEKFFIGTKFKGVGSYDFYAMSEKGYMSEAVGTNLAHLIAEVEGIEEVYCNSIEGRSEEQYAEIRQIADEYIRAED